MRKIAVWLLSLVTFIGVALIFYPTTVSADNDDPSTPSCNITVNGVQASSTDDSAPASFSRHKNGEQQPGEGYIPYFDIKVSLSADAAEYYNDCGKPGLKLSVLEPLWFDGSTALSSTGGNNYTGGLERGMTTEGSGNVRALDVETTSGGNCPAAEPICRRAWIEFHSYPTEDNDTCQEEVNSFSASFESMPRMIDQGKSISVSFNANSELFNTCEIYDITYSLTRGGSTEDTGKINQGSTSLSLTPKFIGQYSLIVRLNEAKCDTNKNSTTPICTSGSALQTITRNFCVKNASDTECEWEEEESSSIGDSPFVLCTQVANEDDLGKCEDCIGDPDNPKGIWTAIGCIPVEPTSIIQTFITLGLSLGGGITLLLVLAGAFRLSVSAGDPKQAEEAKEQITSAVIGLLFIIFSIVMLRFIGVQVLQIPGFGG